MSLCTADTCVFRVILFNFLHEKQSSNIPRVQYSLHFPSSISFLILQVLLFLLLYRHIHRLCLVSFLGPASNSKNIPSNTSDFSFYLILLLIFFISCAFCIIKIIDIPTAAIIDGGQATSLHSLLLKLGPNLCMKIFPVGTFNV